MSSSQPGQTTHADGQFPFSKRTKVRTIKSMTPNPALAILPAQEGAPRIGERLVALRLINEGQLRRALELQQQSSRPLGAVLLDLGVLDEDRLTAALGEHL